MQKLKHLDQETMGRITAQLTISNRGDEVMAERGVLAPEKVRRISVDDALVDTDATLLCLPRELIKRLGLPLLREAQASTSAGMRRVRVFRDASITLLGRTGTFECLELPGGKAVLIGTLPLEALGIELDLKNQTLKLLPDTGDKTYLLAYRA